MDVIDFTQYFLVMFVLLGVLGALAFLAYAVQRGWLLQNLTGLKRLSPSQRRLSVSETLVIDPRRRVVILKTDGLEHTILLGVDRETVLNTAPAQSAPLEENAS